MLVRTTYLELSADEPLCRSNRKRPNYELHRAIAPSPELARFLYTAVGYSWNWSNRLSWTYKEWENYLTDQRIETWIVYVTGSIAGYFELAIDDDGVEIRALGMLPRFTGCGIGSFLLCDAADDSRSTRGSFAPGVLMITMPAALRSTAEDMAVSAAKLIHPVRLAVSGQSEGPGLFELLELLGKMTCIRRLRKALTIFPLTND